MNSYRPAPDNHGVPYPQATGERIAYHRKRLGLSQAEFAGLVDRSESWVSQVERGVRPVDRMSVLKKVADVLSVPVSELQGDEESLKISTRIIFYVDTPGERERALDRRDEIVDKLAEIGLRPSATDGGLHVFLVDDRIRVEDRDEQG